MLGKSTLIKGTINGTPFIYWNDKEFEAEIEFDEPVHLDEVSQSILTVSFNLTYLFEPAFGGIDISTAIDGNQNGSIEIYPGNSDGNNYFLDPVMQRITYVIEAFEDKPGLEEPSVNGFTYNGTTYPLTNGYFEYYGPIGGNTNSFKFDLVLTDGGINFITEIGKGNFIYFEVWSNTSNEPAPGIYTIGFAANPFTYTDGEIGFNANLQTDAGVFIDVAGGNLVLSKSGDQHTFSANLILDNGKPLTIRFTGVFTKI